MMDQFGCISGLTVHTCSQVAAAFRAKFGENGTVCRAPGRVNLIGEHTDYNQGLVLPAAINLSCWVASSPRKDHQFVLYSENFNEQVEVPLDAIASVPRGGWASYPLGVVWSLQRRGHATHARNIYIAGDVPLGSGLSSSAAIEVATAYAVLGEAVASIGQKTLALLCQSAENEYVGARCGIMDQFIACHGQARHAVLLDCRSLEWRPIPLPAEAALVVCNTMVKHDLAANEYNVRRAECEAGVRALRTAMPSISSLRDVSAKQLELHCRLLPEKIHRRCRHVVKENERVLRMAAALERNDLHSVRELMAESHASLRADYEVSCDELDLMVEIAQAHPGVLGARMTGGGFGGCTVNLVEKEHVQDFAHIMRLEYQKETGLQPEVYCLEAAQGAGVSS